jgi:hypothetical protein
MDLVIGGSQGKDSRQDITIYRNTTKSAGHYLNIQPRMPAPNPYAVGAVVEVFDANEADKANAVPYFVEKAHADATPIHVGLDTRTSCDVRVTFPGGKVVVARNVRADQTVTIDREPAKASSRQR